MLRLQLLKQEHEPIPMPSSPSYVPCLRYSPSHHIEQFINLLLQSQVELQHLWYGRRASTRIRTELMASIYAKSLKRKDFSGIVDKDGQSGSKMNKGSFSVILVILVIVPH